MAKKIKFATKHPYLAFPISAKKSIPDWYKNSPKTTDGKQLRLDLSGNINASMKMCMPFLDSMTSGYVMTTWQDIQVTIIDGTPALSWAVKPDVVDLRDDSFSGHLPVPSGHSPAHFIWKNEFIIKTPSGYSVLITHPFNRFDLPFTTLSAVVDADEAVAEGGVSFFIKDGFEGVIPAGTPMFQLLPFKREDWIAEKDEAIIAAADEQAYRSKSVVGGWYRKNIWKRKTYK